jgi:hypothetical protein
MRRDARRPGGVGLAAGGEDFGGDLAGEELFAAGETDLGPDRAFRAVRQLDGDTLDADAPRSAHGAA